MYMHAQMSETHVRTSTNKPHRRPHTRAGRDLPDACTRMHTLKPHRRTQTRSLTRARIYLFESGGNDLVFRSNHQSHQSRERKWHKLNKSAEKERKRKRKRKSKKSQPIEEIIEANPHSRSLAFDPRVGIKENARDRESSVKVTWFPAGK